MGGDHAPAAVVDGAVAASARHPGVRIALVGPEALLEVALASHPEWRRFGIEIVEAPDVIAMDDPPAATLRRKPRASIRVAADLVAQETAGALVSAGNTGATVECRPHHLLWFAVMGSVYARIALEVERPRVGLLSIGEEATKGNELTRGAHRLLEASPLNFVGNVEGGNIYSGIADVIVCDGFTGNVVLKTSEGLVETVEALLGDELRRTFSSQVGYLLSRRAFRRLRRRVDYSEYGGAPLRGVAGLAIVGHGRSSAKAVRNAIAMAHRFATSNFIQRVEREIAATSVPGR